MVGSVAGVGQFLETVGVPGPQVGTQTGADNSTPAQDFASALQQAGGPTPQELAAPVNGREDAKTGSKSDDSADTKGTAGAQDGSVTTAGAGKPAAADSSVPRSTVVQLPGSAGRGMSASIATASLAGNKHAEVASAKPVEIALTDEIVPLKTCAEVEKAAPVSLSGTATLPTPADAVPGQGASVAAQAASAIVPSVKSAASLATTAKVGEQPKADSPKPTVKTVSSVAIDSKLTALMPQGTLDMAQGANLAASAAPLPAPAAVPSVVDDAVSGASRTVVTATLGTPAPAAASVRVAAAQAANDRQPKKATTDLVDEAAPVATLTTDNAPVAGKIASEQAEVSRAVLPAEIQVAAAGSRSTSATIAASTKGIAGAPQGAASVPGVPVANAALAAQAAVSQTAAGSPEQTSVSFQAALQTAPPVEAIASKPVSQGGRTAVPAVKAAGETVGAGSANPAAAPVVAVPTGSATSAVPAQPTVPMPAPPAVAAHAAVAGPKASVKAGSEAAPVQGVPPSAKVTVAAEGVSTPETPAKVSGDAGHAVAASQPAQSLVETVTVVPAVAASVPLPVVHEAAAGTANVGTASAGLAGTAGMVAATQESGGVAGLSHTTLSSSPTSLEVGVASGTHGWLKIRAELNATGEVNASLTGTTPAAAEKLRGEMPALSNYLQSERVAMGTLDVRSALHTAATFGESSATFSQAGSGQGSAHPGSGQPNTGGAAVSADAGSAGSRAQQQTPRGGDVVPVVGGTGDEVVPGRLSDAALYTNSIELGDNAGPSPVGYGAGGGWLNVRA